MNSDATVFEIQADDGTIVEIEGDRQPTKAEAMKAIAMVRDRSASGPSLGEKAANVVGDVAAEAGGATVGQMLGVLGGPFAWATVPAGGAIGGAIGNVIKQAREIARGERDGFSPGQMLGTAAVSAIPAGQFAKAGGTVAATASKRALQAAALGTGAKTVETLVDRGELPTWGEVGWAAGGGLVFGSALGVFEQKVANVLARKTPQEAKAVLEKAIVANADEAEKARLVELQSFIDQKLGIGAKTKDAADSAAVLAGENPPPVKSAAESADAMAPALAEREQRAAQFTHAKTEEAARGLKERQLAGDEVVALGDDAAKNQQTALDVRVGSESATRERARLDAVMEATHGKSEDGALPLGVQLSAQAQRIYDQHGGISPRLAASLAGGSAGTVYGFSQGETPEERAANALKFGVLGFGAGAGIGTVIRHVSGPSSASRSSEYRTYLEGLAKGTDGMPDWYLRFRSAEPIVKLRESMLNARTRVKDTVAATAGGVAEDANPYLAGKLFPGRVAARVKIEADQAAQAAVWNRDKAADVWAKATGGNVEDFNARLNDYMVAKAAPDYNAAHADFTARTGKAAAGISDPDAAQVITKAKADGLESVFEDLRKQVRAIDEAVLDTLEDGQLVSASQAAALRQRFPEHVPLNRVLPDSSDDSIVGAVFGVPRFNTRGSGVKEGAGSDLVVDDVYASTLTNLKDAIIRAERNKVALAAVRFFDDHPVPGVSVTRPKPIGTQSDGTPILPQPDTNATLVAREAADIAKPAHQVWVQFDDPLVARAFNGMNVEQTNTLLRWMSVPTHLLAGLYTRFNLGFIPSNKIRDLQEAVTTIATSGDWKAAAKIPANSFRDMKAVSDWLRGQKTPDAAIYEEVMLRGGFTGGLATSTRDSAEKTIAQMSRRNPAEKAKDVTLGFFDFLNEVAEDSTRLSAARAAKDAGASDNLAALAGRESGVDFNQKGTLTNQVNSLYAFVNPSVQGAVRAGKSAIRSPEAIGAAAVGLTGVGLAVDAWNRSIEPDWKNNRSLQFYRGNSIPILLSSDDAGYYVFTLPVAQLLRPVKALVDLGQDLVAGEIRDPRQAASRIAAAAAESLNPLGGQNVREAVTPTLADPLVDVLANESYTGAKIHPQGRPGDPDLAKVWPDTINTQTGQAAMSASRILARIGVDVSPESLLYAAKSYTGGPGELATQGANIAHATTTPGAKASPRDIPVVSRFVRYVRKDATAVDASAKRIVDEERTKSATERLELQAEALRWVQRGNAADDAGKQALLAELQSNPRLRKAVGTVIDREAVKLDPLERDLASLTVGDGARARAVVRVLRALPEDQRLPVLKQMRERGIVSREVLKQIGTMQDAGRN